MLDEPSSNMDTGAIHRLTDILAKLKQNKKTVVVSEHRLYYMMDIADRFIYMEDGRIRHSFTPEELKKMPEKERKKLGLRIPDLSETVYKVRPDKKRKDWESGIRIQDLKCVRNRQTVLDIPDIDLPKGGVIAVIGENGAGRVPVLTYSR